MTAADPSNRRGQQRGLATRHELLEAALREFASVGFDAASTRAIAARAGVRQGQLTYHYETKDALWRATRSGIYGAAAAFRGHTQASRLTCAARFSYSAIRCEVHSVMQALRVYGCPQTDSCRNP